MQKSGNRGQIRLILAAGAVSAVLSVLATLLAIGYLKQKDLQETAQLESQNARQAAQAARDAANLGNRARDEAEALVEFLIDDLHTELDVIGRSDLLVAAAEKTIAYFDHLPSELVTRDSKIKQASVLFNLARTQQDTGDLDGAIATALRCIEVRKDIASSNDPDGYRAYHVGRTMGELGHFYVAADNYKAARDTYQRSLEHFRNPPEGADKEGDWIYGVCQALNGLGGIETRLGNSKKALPYYKESIQLLTKALAKRPDEVLWVNQLGLAHNNSGVEYRNLDDYVASQKSYEGAANAVRELMRIEPDNRRYEKQLATVLGNLGRLARQQKDFPTAWKYLSESLELREGLCQWDSKNTRFMLNLAHGWRNHANYFFDTKDTEKGVEAIKNSLKVYRRLFQVEANNASWIRDLDRELNRFLERLTEANLKEETLAVLSDTAAFAEDIRAGKAGSEGWDGLLDALYTDISRLGGTVSSSSIIEPRRRTLETHAAEVTANPTDEEAIYTWALGCINLGRAFQDAGLPGSALPCIRFGRYVLTEHVSTGYGQRKLFLDQAERRDVGISIEGDLLPDPTTLIALGSTWRFHDKSTQPLAQWTETSFDDSKWQLGAAPLGYGEPDIKTTLNYGDNSRQKHMTVWLRQTFDLESPSTVTNLYLSIRRDDGAVVYLNGKEILRDSMPSGVIEPNTAAIMTQDEEEKALHIFNIAAENLSLQKGKNVIAIEVHQNEPRSSDLALDFELLSNFNPPDPKGYNEERLAEILGNALPSFRKR